MFTAGADPVMTVASIAQLAGCQGLPIPVVSVCGHKTHTRTALDNGKVAQPRWLLAKGPLDIEDAQMWLGENIIIKATGSSGSRGHTRVTGFKSTPAPLAAQAWSAAVQHSHSGSVLVEELLTGRELSVETLWYNGSMIPLNAVERPFLDHPRYSIELGHYNPAVLCVTTYDDIWHIMEQAGRAVGMGDVCGGHIFKGDLILTDDGPKVLEVTPRLSGGFDSGWTSPLAHGVNYTKGALLLALGEPLEKAMPFFVPRWYRHAACMAVLGPSGGGIIKEIKGLAEARKWGEVICRFSVGDTVPPLVDCASRIVFCIYGGHYSPDIAQARAQIMTEMIEVVME